ncbi:MAG TPA: hypothetical protein VFV34_18645 [Blastocatellia bacterium]|nr:hypothetical protein [Blastocatellia bacterium]
MTALIARLVVVSTMTLSSGKTSGIVGTWVSVKDDDKPSWVLVFRRDGSFSSTFGVVGEESYEVVNNRIITYPDDPDSEGPHDGFEFRVERNTLVLKMNGEEVTLKRLSRQLHGGSALIGRWGLRGSFLHGGPNGLWEMAFTKDKRCIFKMLREPGWGRYRIRNNLLTTTIEINGAKSSKFRLRIGVLFLEPTDGTAAQEYRRLAPAF